MPPAQGKDLSGGRGVNLARGSDLFSKLQAAVLTGVAVNGTSGFGTKWRRRDGPWEKRRGEKGMNGCVAMSVVVPCNNVLVGGHPQM